MKHNKVNSSYSPIRSILIANRGEIAVRIIKTARKLGIRSIAVYSQADKNALHVELADDAMLIGPAPAPQSYLSIDNIIEAAKKSGADAIHPGYGFLSENNEFAHACSEENITFIGPQIDAMKIMGNKADAKLAMEKCGVPTIAGYQGEDQTLEGFCAAASKIGFPLMVKAAFGGGGRGMRIVNDLSSLAPAIEQAREEAISGFGDGRLILEKSISGGRHIEFQILGDVSGNLVHLGERDCSLQRRHQKVIEEAPSPALDDQLRKNMAIAAISAAKSVSYIGAGTVEFLLDENDEFYFLEMNTRLQVEHPVTELVTGIDLVEWQIRVAAGEPLGFKQNEIKFCGHAIEARLYAEDPEQNFAPSFGRVEHWCEPSGRDVRVDSGVGTGQVISPYYDAMVAKVIVHDSDRKSAAASLIGALHSTVLFGPAHNKNFLLDLLSGDSFSEGTTTTEYIDTQHSFKCDDARELKNACIVAVLDFCDQREKAWLKSGMTTKTLLNWASCRLGQKRFIYRGQCDDYQINVQFIHPKNFVVSCAQLDAPLVLDEPALDSHKFSRVGENCYSQIDGRHCQFVDISRWADASDQKEASGKILATMHGVLAAISISEGDQVEPSSVLGTVEAMKMRHDILAGVSGKIVAIHKQCESQIATGELLFEIEISEDSNAAGT